MYMVHTICKLCSYISHINKWIMTNYTNIFYQGWVGTHSDVEPFVLESRVKWSKNQDASWVAWV